MDIVYLSLILQSSSPTTSPNQQSTTMEALGFNVRLSPLAHPFSADPTRVFLSRCPPDTSKASSGATKAAYSPKRSTIT